MVRYLMRPVWLGALWVGRPIVQPLWLMLLVLLALWELVWDCTWWFLNTCIPRPIMWVLVLFVGAVLFMVTIVVRGCGGKDNRVEQWCSQRGYAIRHYLYPKEEDV